MMASRQDLLVTDWRSARAFEQVDCGSTHVSTPGTDRKGCLKAEWLPIAACGGYPRVGVFDGSRRDGHNR